MTTDVGLFGPGSVTWEVHADPAGFLGGLRALLLQALHPLVMAGVDQHSDFRVDPWGRLERTILFVSTATYGSTPEAEMMGAQVRAMHARVNGTDPVTGRSYRADDPELLAFVHNALVDSVLAAKRRYGGGLSDADADQYLREMVRMAELVGTPTELVPTSVAALRVYFRDIEYVATPAAMETLHMVMAPSGLPLLGRPLWSVADAAVVGILPTEVRRLYGLPWPPQPAAWLVQEAIARLVAALKLVRPPSPERAAAEARKAVEAYMAA